jgi:hypothetical protein
MAEDTQGFYPMLSWTNYVGDGAAISMTDKVRLSWSTAAAGVSDVEIAIARRIRTSGSVIPLFTTLVHGPSASDIAIPINLATHLGLRDDIVVTERSRAFNPSTSVALLFDSLTIQYSGILGVAEAVRPTPSPSVVAFPNPARGSMTFRLRLSSPATVTGDIFDIAGRRRARVLPGIAMSAGAYDAHWNGTDENGQRLPAGLYFVSIRADGARLGREESFLILK